MFPPGTSLQRRIHNCNYNYLDLQDIVATQAFTMHFIIRIVCVTTRFILDECKPKIHHNKRKGDIRGVC